jgi:hypothetical protein
VLRGNPEGMRSRGVLTRWERRQFRRLTKDLASVPGFSDPDRPPRHMAKDVLGAVVTLAIFGAVLLEVTDGLASRCGAGARARAGSGACTGVRAFAHQAQGAVTLTVGACAALAALAFVWYMFWGYKANGQASEAGRPSDL